MAHVSPLSYFEQPICAMYFYKILHIFVAISTLISILNGSKIDKTLTGLVQNDPLLIKTIQEQFLVKPTSSDKDYNFTAHRYMSSQIYYL